MIDILQWISFLSAACAAITSTVGGIKARSLLPDSLPNIQELVRIIDGHLTANKHFLKPALEHINKTQGLGSPFDSSTRVGFEIAEERIGKLHDELRTWEALKTTDATIAAANARLWMVGGAVFAAISVASQALSACL